MKKLRYALEAIALHALFIIFKNLPPAKASAFGGWLGRNIGGRLAANRKAYKHLSYAFPDMDDAGKAVIVNRMWNNLGRIIAEYPHLEHIGAHMTEISAPQSFYDALKCGEPIIFFGGHIGNWEVNSAATLMQAKHAVDATYRAPNNPWSDKLLSKARTLNGRLNAYPKSSAGGRQIVKALKANNSIGILIDQKYNEGIEVPFFGVAAMTNPAFVQFSQKFKCHLFPIRNERLNDSCEFRLNVYEPLSVFDEAGEKRGIEDVIKDAHTMLEDWIKDRPEQWIWLHRRWKD